MKSIFTIVRRWFRFGSKPGLSQQNSKAALTETVVSEVTADLLQDLRSASENRVKGPLWSLPRVTTGDPQPMLKHQAAAITRLSQNDFKSGVIHLPTGSGKTRVGIEIAARCLQNPQDRVIWATSGVSLLRQSVIRLVEMLGRFDRELTMRWAGSDHVQDKALFDEADVLFN